MSSNSQVGLEELRKARPEWREFIGRLGELSQGMTHRELGEIVGASESTVHHWFNSGRIPRERYLRRLEAHFGKPQGWLLGDREIERLRQQQEYLANRGLLPAVQPKPQPKPLPPEPQKRMERRKRIPILQVEVGAGNGRLNGDEYVQEYFEVPEGLIPWKGDLSIVSVCGDSMEPTYRHGDLVIVQPEHRIMDAAMVLSWEDALVVKRVLRVGAKTVKLISDNPAYESVMLAISEIRVIGRVVGLIRWNA